MCMLWFSFVLCFIFLSFNLIIIHFQTPRQRKMKIKPRIKLNHNIYIGMFLNMQLNSTLCLHEKPKEIVFQSCSQCSVFK